MTSFRVQKEEFLGGVVRVHVSLRLVWAQNSNFASSEAFICVPTTILHSPHLDSKDVLMARLTEIQDGSDSDTPRSASSTKRTKGSKSAGLTQDEQEQILHKSGLIEKLGLPKDFVTMDQAQSELDALNRSKKRPSGKPNKESKKDANEMEEEEDDSEDDYGVDSDHELDGDDTANRLMQEQEATEMSPKVESFLDLVIWTMPFGFMYTLLDVLVRQQYGETIGFKDEALRLARALPGK